MPRFVILEHDWPRRHWDLLLEEGLILKAWRLEEELGMHNRCVVVEPNLDHRLIYLSYEGPIAGDRGSVTRWDFGNFEGEISSQEWTLRLHGQRIQGRLELKQTGAGWVAIYEPDSV